MSKLSFPGMIVYCHLLLLVFIHPHHQNVVESLIEQVKSLGGDVPPEIKQAIIQLEGKYK